MEMSSRQITGILGAVQTQYETEDIIHDQQKQLDDLKKVLKTCLKREMRIDLQRKVYVVESNIKALRRKLFFIDAQKKIIKQ